MLVLKNLLSEFDSYQLELAQRSLSDKTVRKYMTDCKQFITFLTKDLHLPFEQTITKGELNIYKDFLYENFKASTAGGKIVSVNMLLKHCGSPDLIKAKRVQRRTSLKNVITLREYKTLLQWAEKRNDNKKCIICLKHLQTQGCVFRS